jgi:hypothetical protein
VFFVVVFWGEADLGFDEGRRDEARFEKVVGWDEVLEAVERCDVGWAEGCAEIGDGFGGLCGCVCEVVWVVYGAGELREWVFLAA